ncbi:hypothetical protein HBB16_00575 [Pseudonocardia sp. MCCB 268]|nr:hypothetical protein [Pseudonocardia cytotoxica]
MLRPLDVLRLFHRLGARYLTLTHLKNTGWADSCTDVVDTGGLSDFGRAVVTELSTTWGCSSTCPHLARHHGRGARRCRAHRPSSPTPGPTPCAGTRNVRTRARRVRSTGGIVIFVFLPTF